MNDKQKRQDVEVYSNAGESAYNAHEEVKGLHFV